MIKQSVNLNRWLTSLVLLFFVGLLQMWAGSYTITFMTASNDNPSSGYSTTTACSSVVSGGASYLSGNLVTATCAYGPGTYGLKLGKSSSPSEGVIKMNLASSVTPSSIVVNCKRFASGTAATLSVNGSATQPVPADAVNITFNITSSTSYIELTASKYIWVTSITVNTNTGTTLTDVVSAIGFGGYTTDSYSAGETDRSAVANSTNATSVTYALQSFNGSSGAVRGNGSGATNFNARNTTTKAGYFISKIQLTVSNGKDDGTIDGSTSGRSIVYFGTSAYSNPGTTAPSGYATVANPASSGQSTLTWYNGDENISYFILYGLKTSGTTKSARVEVTWSPKTYTVNWVVKDNDSYHTQTNYVGTALTDPGTPTSSDCNGTKVFVGWSESEIDGTTDSEPGDLFTSVSGKKIPVSGTTYYAVFATESEGGGTEYVFTDYDEVTAGTYVIASYNTTTSKYVALTGGIVTSSSNKDLENETTGFTLTNNKFTTLPTGACEFTLAGNSSDGFTIKNGETNGYLGYAAQGTSRLLDFGSDYSSFTWKVASEIDAGYPDGCYIHRGLEQNYTISTNSNNTSSQVRGYTGTTAYNPIYFFKKGSSVSYSEYETECAPTCADPTAAGHGTINMTTQKMPITWTTAADNVDVCYSTSSEKPGSSPGEGYTVKSGITASTEIDSLDISGLSAGNYYTWVRSVCDESSKSNWVAITDNYFTVPGHTLTISPSPASSGSFSPTSGQTVVEKRSVSITATPAAGYTFTSWAVSGTGSTLSSTTDNPTTFTMGTADATVTATFSEKTVTGWTWTNHRGGATITSDAIVVYVGQKVQLDIAYLPADVLSSHTAASNYSYDRSDRDSYLKYESKASGYFRFSGKAAKSSTSISFTHSEDTSSPKEFVKTVNVEVRALPTDTYLDLVHGISFSGPYGASLIDSDYGVQFTYTAPGGDVSDWSSTYANTCEQYHVHLIGWVESTWADEHLGDAEMPNTAAITSSGYYYPVGETMTVSGKTYYAVWAKVE